MRMLKGWNADLAHGVPGPLQLIGDADDGALESATIAGGVLDGHFQQAKDRILPEEAQGRGSYVAIDGLLLPGGRKGWVMNDSGHGEGAWPTMRRLQCDLPINRCVGQRNRGALKGDAIWRYGPATGLEAHGTDVSGAEVGHDEEQQG